MYRLSGRTRGRALRDVGYAAVASLALGVLLVRFVGAPPLAGIAAVAVGMVPVSVGALCIARRRPLFSTPADRLTLTRAVLAAGCASVVVLGLFAVVPHRSWLLVALAAPAVALDAVDGRVARWTGTAGPEGARLDMETDAVLLLVLSVPLAFTLGPWVLVIGLLRYAFAALALGRPALRGELEFSQFRRVVAGVQSVVLVVALVPALALPVATAGVAGSLVLLVVSFARDVLVLERRYRGHAGAGSARQRIRR